MRLVEHRQIHQSQVRDVKLEPAVLLDFGDRPVGDREAQASGMITKSFVFKVVSP
jgi:hypothetical protein